MTARRFRSRKKASRSDADAVSRRFSGVPLEGITVEWLLERMGFDPASFWNEANPVRHLDPQVALETVSAAHAETGFPLFLRVWDDVDDHEYDGQSFAGRLIAAAMQHQGHDWPLDRSWFHDLYIDLARLDGALGIDLSSEEQLRNAVSCYWKRIGVLARAHATAIRLDIATNATKTEHESFMAMRQLALL